MKSLEGFILYPIVGEYRQLIFISLTLLSSDLQIIFIQSRGGGNRTRVDTIDDPQPLSRRSR